MARKLQVVAYQQGWDVIYEGAKYAESHHASRMDAVAAAVDQACREGAVLEIFDAEGHLCSQRRLPHAALA